MNTLTETNLTDFKLFKKGKVRDIYNYDKNVLLAIFTDRVSVFDVNLIGGIPGRGILLNEISNFWFEFTKNIIPNHKLNITDAIPFPERSILAIKADLIPIECIVRGYISGSAWKEYQKSKSICGFSLPDSLQESDKISPIFTPSTKLEEHDRNITFKEMVEILTKWIEEKGESYNGPSSLDIAHLLEDFSLEIYQKAAAYALKKGIIIADTKFEFGLSNNKVILIDEVLTPDSSRFWDEKTYSPGRSQYSFDKQIVRDYVKSIGKVGESVKLPDEIINKTIDRYRQIKKILIW